MKITNSTVNKAYKTTLRIKEELSVKKQDSVFENTDVVSMSQQAKNANFASKVSKNICEDVEANYSAAKLNALKQKIQNGEYRVSDEALADALISHTWEA
ncbi:MAG: flagellar biosynthesis anti-sigma factor FlgM [Erysipelotrichales bacterium]|nr:flagellar biosynthesis anti-sigma factor FlgM [Erysipelotrichales bacterium]